VLDDALADLVGEVEAGEFGVADLELLDQPQALAIVFEATVILHQLRQQVLAAVAEGWMTDVVDQGDAFDQVLVQAQPPCRHASDLRHLDGVGQAGAEVVAFVVGEDLGLVLQPAERAAMDDAVAVALVFAAEGVGDAAVLPATRCGRAHGMGCQRGVLALFDVGAGEGHGTHGHGCSMGWCPGRGEGLPWTVAQSPGPVARGGAAVSAGFRPRR
jgi:hypothetical protein